MNPFLKTRYRRRALRAGLSRGEIRALERFGFEPFSWEQK